MYHSLIGADRRTHGKILAVALAGVISLVMFAGPAWLAKTDAGTAGAQASGAILKVSRPAVSAAADAPLIR